MKGERIVTKYTAPEDLLGTVRPRMTRTEAIHRVAVLAGGISQGNDGLVYRFTDLDRADAAHELLNALDPGCTGDVFHDGRLMVQPTSTYDDQPPRRLRVEQVDKFDPTDWVWAIVEPDGSVLDRYETKIEAEADLPSQQATYDAQESG